MLARAWQMPEPAVEAIEFHHDVGNSPRENPLVEIVHIVDLLCRMRGIGYGYEEWRAIELAGLGPSSLVLPAPWHHGLDSIHLWYGYSWSASRRRWKPSTAATNTEKLTRFRFAR